MNFASVRAGSRSRTPEALRRLGRRGDCQPPDMNGKRAKPRRGAGIGIARFPPPHRGLSLSLTGNRWFCSRRGDLMSDVPPGQPLLIRPKVHDML